MSKLAHSNDATMRAIELKEGERGNIVTDYVYPPIPIRRFDWCARRYGGDENSLCGWGATEDAAIADLLMLEDE